MPKLSDPEFCKRLFQQFADKPLEPGDARYEPLYEEHPDLKNYDHAANLAKTIQFSEIESLNLLSGFRGSGKSTELNRLADMLRGSSHLVLQRDALDYLDPGESIDIVTLLNALAGAFSDALEEDEIGEALKDGNWKRFSTYLKTTNVSLDEIGIKAGTPAKTAEASLKLAFKTAPTFRQQLREKLQARLGPSGCRRSSAKRRPTSGASAHHHPHRAAAAGAPWRGSPGYPARLLRRTSWRRAGRSGRDAPGARRAGAQGGSLRPARGLRGSPNPPAAAARQPASPPLPLGGSRGRPAGSRGRHGGKLWQHCGLAVPAFRSLPLPVRARRQAGR